MKTTIYQRIGILLDYLRVSQEEFRILMRVKNKQQISAWITAKENIPEKYIIRIIEMYPELNARWLITGDGQMLNDRPENAYPENGKVNMDKESFVLPYIQQLEMAKELKEVQDKYVKILERENEEFRNKNSGGG